MFRKFRDINEFMFIIELHYFTVKIIQKLIKSNFEMYIKYTC